jgi:hypothetical protein
VSECYIVFAVEAYYQSRNHQQNEYLSAGMYNDINNYNYLRVTKQDAIFQEN